MIQYKNAPSPILYLCFVAAAGMMIFLGCANRSAVNVPTSNFFGRASETTTAADLKVNESYSTSTKWFESYESAHRESLRTGKPILALFTGSDWCGPCINLKKKVFNTPEFQTWSDEKVVLLKLDYPKRTAQDPKLKTQNAGLARKYDIKGYPTVLFLDANGNPVGKLGHGTDAKQWIASADRKLR